jgi:hypothetical protein
MRTEEFVPYFTLMLNFKLTEFLIWIAICSMMFSVWNLNCFLTSQCSCTGIHGISATPSENVMPPVFDSLLTKNTLLWLHLTFMEFTLWRNARRFCVVNLYCSTLHKCMYASPEHLMALCTPVYNWLRCCHLLIMLCCNAEWTAATESQKVLSAQKYTDHLAI